MKKALIKTLVLIPIFAILAIFPLQGAFACQQDGSTCQNDTDHPDQTCCSNDNELECWDIIADQRAEGDTIGVCRPKEPAE